MANGNTFGVLFSVTTYGESHGGAVGVVVDGCPPRLPLSEADIQAELDRRRPGQSQITTPRQEADRCEILSGVFQGFTLGTPIHILVRNQDARPQDYSEMATTFRPSHADATYQAKYGIRNWQGEDGPQRGRPLAGWLPEPLPRRSCAWRQGWRSWPTCNGSKTWRPRWIPAQ